MSVTVGKTTVYKLRDVRSGLSEYGVRLSLLCAASDASIFCVGAETRVLCTARVAMSNI